VIVVATLVAAITTVGVIVIVVGGNVFDAVGSVICDCGVVIVGYTVCYIFGDIAVCVDGGDVDGGCDVAVVGVGGVTVVGDVVSVVVPFSLRLLFPLSLSVSLSIVWVVSSASAFPTLLSLPVALFFAWILFLMC